MVKTNKIFAWILVIVLSVLMFVGKTLFDFKKIKNQVAADKEFIYQNKEELYEPIESNKELYERVLQNLSESNATKIYLEDVGKEFDKRKKISDEEQFIIENMEDLKYIKENSRFDLIEKWHPENDIIKLRQVYYEMKDYLDVTVVCRINPDKTYNWGHYWTSSTYPTLSKRIYYNIYFKNNHQNILELLEDL